jgi:DNA-binding transcriptional regulator YiaG
MPPESRAALTAADIEFKHRVRELWIRTGLTQKAFGRQFGVSQRTVIRWMNEGNLVMPTTKHREALKMLMLRNGV